MALQLDKLSELPVWKLAAGWAGASVLILALWYSLYYSDAVDTRDQEKATLVRTQKEREEMEAKLAGFEEEMERAAAAQKEIDAAMEVLPMSSASVDHMMRTFQQQGRLVGLTFDQWSPQAEARTAFYAKTAVKVSITGTWNQLGEFFRRISELKTIVSIHDLKIKAGSGRSSKDKSTRPKLSVRFTASTYRFLSDQERAGNKAKPKSRRRGKRG